VDPKCDLWDRSLVVNCTISDSTVYYQLPLIISSTGHKPKHSIIGQSTCSVLMKALH